MRRRERLKALAMVFPPVLVIAVFIGFPVALAIAYSFGYVGGPNASVSSVALHQHTAGGGLATISAYRGVVTSGQFLSDLAATVWVSVATIIVVLVVSAGVALYVRLSQGWVARVAAALLVVPLFIPVVIASYAILVFWGPAGFVETVAHHLGLDSLPPMGYHLGGVLIAEVWVNLPFGVLMMTSGFASVADPLIEAARDAGASTLQVVRTVLVPMNLVPLTIVATFTGIYVLGSFTVPYLVGPSSPNLLGSIMTTTFQAFSEPQQAAVMAVIVFVIASGIGSVYVWANVRANRERGVL